MRIYHIYKYIALMIVILSCHCQNFILSMEDKFKCPTRCKNGQQSIVTVQTAVSSSANINRNIGNFTAIVNYVCKNIMIVGGLEGKNQNLYQRLCKDKIEYCKEHKWGHKGSWKNIYSDRPEPLKVDIRLPIEVEKFTIGITKCVENATVFKFSINGTEINYTKNPLFKFDQNVFSTTDLSDYQLTLEIIEFETTKQSRIEFDLSKSKCKYGFHEDFNNGLGYKCFLNLTNQRVEGGYVNVLCPSEEPPRTSSITKDACAFFGEVCQHECYNLPGCSYLCAVPPGTDDVLYEGGYVMNKPNAVYPNVIGSGQWKFNEIPINLALFDECKSNATMCELGNDYCRDEDVSFSCTNGSYNMKNCMAGKSQSPYWRCPANDAAISMMLRTPGLLKTKENSISFKNEIMTQYSNRSGSMKTAKAFYGIIKDLASNRSNDLFNLPPKEKRNFASFLLNRFADDYCKYSRTNKAFDDDSFFFSAVDIDHDKEEVDIEMSPGSNETNAQFIKLELKDVASRQNQRVRASYFQYKNMDIMDEQDAVKKNLDNMNSIRDTRISPDDYEDEGEELEEVLYKNSDIFTLKVDTKDVVKTVKYKLRMIEEIRPSSWLYQVENMCGFLDETRNWTWSTSGCLLIQNGTDSYCQCNHLSNFAMLFSMKEVNKKHLRAFEVMSLVGGVINAVSLLLFLIFVLFINSREKLRIDQLNIAMCLLLGTIMFLCGPLFSRNSKLCSAAAMITEFLFLSAFVWKFILGINVVRLIASLRYQNEDWMVKYRWIMLVAGYSVPLVILAISGGLYWSQYGAVADNVCWIDASSKAFLSFLIPVGLIIAVNTVGLFFIANTLIRNYINTRKTRMNDSNELIVFVQLLVSMGFTWIPAYFAIAYLPAMYIFIIFFPLQGLLMFLLVVVINKENREKVSSFIINNYNSITSKSTSVTEGQTHSRSKSTTNSKNTECDNLLTGGDGTHGNRGASEDGVRHTEPTHAASVTRC